MPAPPSRLILSSLAALVGVALAPAAAGAQDAWEHPVVDDPPPSRPTVPRLEAGEHAPPDTTVVVHIDAPEAVELQRRDASGDWRAVCSSPCDRPLEEHGHYRVAGDGVRPSSDVTLTGHGERVALEARPSSNGWFTGGIVLVAVGGASLGTGAFMATVVASLQGVGGASGSHDAGDPGSTSRAGIVLMAAGALAVAAGIIAIVSNPSTAVRVHEAPAATGRTERGGPTWTMPSRIDSAWPHATWVPIFAAQF